MPAPAYVAGGAFANTATKDSALTVNFPEGATVSTSNGHYALLEVQTVEQGAGNTAPSIVGPASGWRQLGPEILASGFGNTRQIRKRLYGRLLVTSDAAPTVQMTGGTAAGVNLSAKISTFSSVGVVRLGTWVTGDAATITLTGITTRQANELLVAFASQSDGNTVSAGDFADAGVTGDTERHDHTVGARVGVAMYTATRVAAGASGNFTATPSATTDPWAGIVLSLAETETFPAQSVADAFTYSDGALATVSSGKWTADTFNFSNPAPLVDTNRLKGIAGDNRAYLVQQVTADGEVAIEVPVLAPSGEKAGVGWRIRQPDSATVDGFEMEADPAFGIRVFRVDDAVYTTLVTYGHQLVAGDVLGVRFTGSDHQIFVVPTTGPKIHVGSVTDAAYNADPAHVAVTLEGTTVRVDNFYAGPLVAPSGIAFTPTADATFQFTPILGIPIGMHFVGTAGATFAVESGTPYPGGPGAGVGGVSKGKAVLLLRRRRGRR